MSQLGRSLGPWPLAPAPWPLASGPWPLVPGPWSLVPGPWPWSLARAHGPGSWPLTRVINFLQRDGTFYNQMVLFTTRLVLFTTALVQMALFTTS